MMDLSVVYSKTAKGLRARTSLIGGLSSQLMKVLTHIDGKSEAETILGKFVQLSEQELASALTQLENEGYIKPVAVRTADDWAPTTNFTPMIVEEYLDEAEVEVRAKEEARLEAERQAREAEEKARIEAEQARARAKEKAEAKVKARLEMERIAREAEEAQKKAEAEARAKAAEEARLEAERKAKAEEEARMEAERIAREAKAEAEQARAKAEAEEKARLEAERKAKAEEKARLEAEHKAREVEEKARIEAEKARAKAEAEAQENARREIERIAREAEEAQKKAEAEARAKAAEEARLEAERKAKAEEEARLEAERKARAEEDTRLEAERAARQAEEQAKVEAEQARAKAEAEEKARIEAEENTRREMKRIIREAEEERKKSEAKAKAARLEAKRKAKADEEARLKAERKAQQEAERVRARAEAEEKARAEAKEKTRLEMERIAQEAEKERKKSKAEVLAKDADEARLMVENETLAKQEAEEKARAEAEEQAEAEAQEKAKLEAEHIAREAEEARNKFFEDDERALSEEDLRELAEEEAELEAGRAPQIEKEELTQEADEKARQDAEDQAREEVKRIAKEDAKAEARLKAQAKTQAMLRVAAASAEKWIKRGIKAALIGLPLLVLLLIGLLPYINLGMLVEPIEKLAAKSTGEPVTVKNVHASLWPEPNLVIGDVAIGVNPGHKIKTAHVTPVTSTLFDPVKVVKSLEIDGLEIEQENFGQPLQWIGNAGKAEHLKIEQMSLKNLSLKIRDLELGPFAGKVGINGSHELKNIELSTADQVLSVQILPHGGSYEIVLSATHWPLPANPKIVFDNLNAKGIFNRNQINFSQLKGEIYGGSFTANAVVDWGNQWSTSGDFHLSRADMTQVLQAFNSAASIDGKLNLAGKFVSKSATAARLAEASDITASFDMGHGSFNGVELTRAVLSRKNQSLAGDSTHFDTLAGSVQIKNGLYQYRKLMLEAPQFHARGQVDVMPNQDISGRISANLAAQSRRLYANFGLTGKVNDVRRQ